MQSKQGIEYYQIYGKTLNLKGYKEKILPHVGEIVQRTDNFTCYLQTQRGACAALAFNNHTHKTRDTDECEPDWPAVEIFMCGSN